MLSAFFEQSVCRSQNPQCASDLAGCAKESFFDLGEGTFAVKVLAAGQAGGSELLR
jgi:hypothetical protein